MGERPAGPPRRHPGPPLPVRCDDPCLGWAARPGCPTSGSSSCGVGPFDRRHTRPRPCTGPSTSTAPARPDVGPAGAGHVRGRQAQLRPTGATWSSERRRLSDGTSAIIGGRTARTLQRILRGARASRSTTSPPHRVARHRTWCSSRPTAAATRTRRSSTSARYRHCASPSACRQALVWLTDNEASGRRNANPHWSPDGRNYGLHRPREHRHRGRPDLDDEVRRHRAPRDLDVAALRLPAGLGPRGYSARPFARSSRRRILPDADLGIASMNSRWRICL